ncbi:hypothetical protein LIER_31102 [Lithospermum erythrorhizon]|uniref:Putative plant transposon protein domain-containing protein n=1 Tax=Lithospermum erythrorhizon TaxID=34254 RepID=A0AAV3RQK8_LITER
MTQKNSNIMGILEEAGVMAIVELTSPYYPKLVQEFICNMSEDIDDTPSSHHHKVTFRNRTFDFSPRLINDHFGRPNGGGTGYNLRTSDIVKVLTAGVVDTWPDKGLPSSRLSVKYVVLYKVGVANWIPTTHNTSVFEALGKFLYMIGTGASFDMGRVFFDQITQHATSHAVLKPILYPKMICSILLSQHNDILTSDDVEGADPGVITITPRLMEGTHVADVPLGPQTE